MNVSKNIYDTIEACRYCPMCKHVCSSEFINFKESDTPRGRSILLYNIYKGGKEYDKDTIESIYNCFLCGCCSSWCEGKEEGGYDIPELIKFARNDIVKKGLEPSIVRKIKESIISNNNIYGIEKEKSFSFSFSEKKCEIVYYMGPDINFKNQEIAQKALKIFSNLGINYTLLRNEPESGKILELLGYFSKARKKAEKLITEVKKTGCRLIIVSDPLAYHAFKKDYPEWGLYFPENIKIMHISEYLESLVNSGKLRLNKSKEKVTLVDSEYLGRFNGIYDPPRNLLKYSNNSNFVELRWNKEQLLATGEAAFVFNSEIFSSGRKLGEKICKEAKNVGAEKIIVLSAVAKRNIQHCYNSNVLDITEYIAGLL